MEAVANGKWEFVHTGGTTLAGKYLRRYWHPVYVSSRLTSGQAVPIQILNDFFTLYRDNEGKPHVTAFRCPHRGTQLSTGWVEGDSIRCFFHGWKFDSTGQCTEQPAEPKPFCHKIKIAVYPTEEQFGLIFAYFGEGSPPPIPRWPELETSGTVASMAVLPCNYFQSAENILDDVHVGFAHSAVPELGGSPRGKTPPRVSAEETSFGLSVAFQNEDCVERNLFIMPNICYVAYSLGYSAAQKQRQFRMRTLFWYVPIDDTSHYHVQVTSGPPFVTDSMRLELEMPHSVKDEILAVLAGKSNVHKEPPVPGKRMPNLVRIQDGVTIAGQGTIADRSQDRLGASDAGVILLRKIWQRELKSLATGKPLVPFTRPTSFD
ncbi:MAG TPA: Rieske 2Fe-2S domain-containing protein [Terriglobia bacterium]|nr:Rieske 2Fe-2S domain-containing protein [Terriglobia bacterium]